MHTCALHALVVFGKDIVITIQQAIILLFQILLHKLIDECTNIESIFLSGNYSLFYTIFFYTNILLYSKLDKHELKQNVMGSYT